MGRIPNLKIQIQKIPSESSKSVEEEVPYKSRPTMVRISYQDILGSYEQIKEAACGRQASSVMVMVAHEVGHFRMIMCLSLVIIDCVRLMPWRLPKCLHCSFGEITLLTVFGRFTILQKLNTHLRLL